MRDPTDAWRTAAADLLLGATCAGCGRPALHVCPACAARLRPRPHVVPGPVVVATGGLHDGTLREVVVAWKEHGRTGLTRVLALHLAAAVLEVVGPRRPLALVPVPTSRRNRRRRGRDHLAGLTRETVAVLRDCGVPARAVPALVLRRQTADQSGLAADERERNVEGAFAVRSEGHGCRPHEHVVVVDDVTTTGATLRSATTALAARGVVVDGAAVVARRP